MKSKHLLNITITGEHTSSSHDKTLWCEIERTADSIILQSDGNGKGTYPLLLASDVAAAGIKAEAGIPYTDCPPEVQALALRLDDPRIKWGHVYDEEREDVEAWLAGELDDPNNGTTRRIEKRREAEKEESARENAFLKEKGYRWEQRNFYCSGEVGDIVDYWALLDPDGTEVVGKRDGGGRIEEFGYVKGLLLQLGYYGQDAIDEHNARVAEQERVAAERSEAREKVDAYFENATPHTPTPDVEERSLSLISISDSSRNRYAITDEGIWKLIYNGMDGDDWSYNNYSMYIASRYDYDADVAEAIEFLSS